jgi:ribosomal protein S27E
MQRVAVMPGPGMMPGMVPGMMLAMAVLCSGATAEATAENNATAHNCTPGTFFNADACHPCAAGTYQPSSAQTSCDACQPGSMMTGEGATACVLCSENYYQPEAGQNSCAECPVGQASPAGATECATCALGSFRGWLGAACEPCPAGTHQPVAGQNCTACAGGTFAPLNSTVCHWCAPGSASEAGAAACVTCAAGSYAEGGQAAPCTPCPVGTALAVAGGTSAANCTACANYTYAAHAGAVDCQWCNGTLLESDGGEVWAEGVQGRRFGCKHQCGQGQFLVHDVAQRLFGCPACAEGTRQWAAVHQHAACEACPARMATLGAGAAVCECAVGYERWNRSGWCEECNAEQHFFKAHVGNASCRKCADEHTIVSSGQCNCGAGYYYEEGKVFCRQCPWYKTTAPGAVGREACACDPVKMVQECSTCDDGCKCAAGHRQDQKLHKCVPCGSDAPCSGLLSGAGRRRDADVLVAACAALLALSLPFA